MEARRSSPPALPEVPRIETAPTDTQRITARLRASGSVFAEEEAALLIGESASTAQLENMVQQRVIGVPLEYIVGWAEFDGIRMSVEPGVFVPRHRTEFLVERAAALARPGTVLFDLCCGVGAIGAAVSARVPGLELYASELDPVAARCARRNIGEAGEVFEGDLFDPVPASLRGRIDVMVANAPYVPSAAIALMPPEAREHEARVTLDGGEDGLDVHRRIAASARDWLAVSGALLIETSVQQSDQTAEIVGRAGLDPRVVHSDEFDATTVIGYALPFR